MIRVFPTLSEVRHNNYHVVLALISDDGGASVSSGGAAQGGDYLRNQELPLESTLSFLKIVADEEEKSKIFKREEISQTKRHFQVQNNLISELEEDRKVRCRNNFFFIIIF